MSGRGPALPPDPAVERLLAEAYLRLRQGNHQEAADKLADAEALAPEHPAVLELKGDLAAARRRFTEAQGLYRRAVELDPANAKLEEKYALAVLKVHEPELMAAMPLDDDDEGLLLGHRRARPPMTSAILSVIFPGAGQLYNGDTVKGWALFAAGMGLWSTFVYAWAYAASHGQGFGLGPAIAGMFRGWYAIFTVLFLAAWLYGIYDAYAVAQATSEEARRRARGIQMPDFPPDLPRKR